MRSVSSGVMPATGSSTSSSFGSCISSMPISSHCFCPCASVPAGDSRSAASPVVSSTASMRSRSRRVRRAKTLCQNDFSPASASSRFSKMVRKSNTVGFWNLRQIPNCAMAGSLSASRLVSLPNHTVPCCGRVLPVTTSIIVVLPAPFGPMTHSSSPGSTCMVRSSSALKPSKLTVTLRMYSTLPLSTDGFRRSAASRLSRHASRLPAAPSGRSPLTRGASSRAGGRPARAEGTAWSRRTPHRARTATRPATRS